MLVRMLAGTWLVPPAVNILLMIIGLLLMRWARRTGMLLLLTGVVSLWLMSTPVFSSLLAATIERYPAVTVETIATSNAQAIIVLGSAHVDHADEYGVSTPAPVGLVRLHYAANLHRRTGLPIMLTGGPMNKGQEVHSEVLAGSLENQFGIKAKWLEKKSATTWQNALFAAEILQAVGIADVVVVTHSYHMQRAMHLFELAGFNVIAAPTRLSTMYPWRDWHYWMPDSRALDLSANVLHEYLGLLWYQLVSPVGNRLEREVRLLPAG